MALGLYKKISLAFIDPTYEECWVRFKRTNFGQYEKLVELVDNVSVQETSREILASISKVIPVLKELFVDGDVLDDAGNHQAMTVDDIDEMPPEFFVAITMTLVGAAAPDPKSQKSSGTSSSSEQKPKLAEQV